MNGRKLLGLIQYFSIGLYIYFLYNKEEDFFKYALYVTICITVLELSYYSLEYFKYYKPGKIFVFKSREYILSFKSIFSKFLGLGFMAYLATKINHLDFNSPEGYALVTLFVIKGILFKNLKNEPRLDKERLMFNDLFSQDIFLKEIKSASIDANEKNIELILINNDCRTIYLDKEFFDKEKERLTSVFSVRGNMKLSPEELQA